MIGDRWAVLIIRDLLLGPMRFSELAESLTTVGTNTLTARLKQLEAAGVVERQPIPLPERGVVYALTEYGRALEEPLLALGRWGARRLGSLPPDSTMRSRWLMGAMLSFHDASRSVSQPTTWELRLTDGVYTAQAEGTSFGITAGSADAPDQVITTDDLTMLGLLTQRIVSRDAIAAGAVKVEGDAALLDELLELAPLPSPQ